MFVGTALTGRRRRTRRRSRATQKAYSQGVVVQIFFLSFARNNRTEKDHLHECSFLVKGHTDTQTDGQTDSHGVLYWLGLPGKSR